MNKLWLSIKSEPYDVECDGSGSTDSMEPRESIEHCKGTGKIGIYECRECGGGGIMTVQLQTKPDKLIEIDDIRDGDNIYFGGIIYGHVCSIKHVAERIMNSYAAGTLPDNIRDCLEEVPAS